MQNLYILRLVPFCLLSLTCQAMDQVTDNAILLKAAAIHAPHNLRDVKVYHDNDKGFFIIEGDKEYPIKNNNLDKSLRNIKSEKLENFQKFGYFSVNKSSDGEFTLKSHVRGKGGGPVTASVLYWLTKSTCYGTAAAAVGVGVAATGGTLIAGAGAIGTAIGGPAVGTAVSTAATMVAGGAVNVGGPLVTAAALGTAGAAKGAAFVAGAIATSAAATEVATVATVGTFVASGGCVATALGLIEGASLSAFAFGMLLPLP